MARIRSIKPEFWKDGRIKRLTPACALFFIGLWNFCDDEGKTRTDSLELSLNLPLFRSQDIVKHMRSLAEAGLIRISRDAEWLLVESWDHQKIDKPRLPKISKSEIEWLEILRKDNSPNALRNLAEESANTSRKDRIGKDRMGVDGTPARTVAPEPPNPPTHPIDSEAVKAAAEKWRDLLRHFKMGRSLLPTEEVELGRAIQKHSLDAVILALEGGKAEPKDDKFDPANFVKLRRYLEPDNFERFLNLGVKARVKAAGAS